MEIYTIGFTKKSAREFFDALRGAGIRLLVDTRLNNRSQLAGFTKSQDLAFFLRELCDASYEHDRRLAPTQDLLDAYKKHMLPWAEYERKFQALMAERRIDLALKKETFSVPTVLLCSEPTPERCHRRLVVEYLDATWGGIEPHHL
jgi:uncharacterized protein (DUF488 family)